MKKRLIIALMVVTTISGSTLPVFAEASSEPINQLSEEVVEGTTKPKANSYQMTSGMYNLNGAANYTAYEDAYRVTGIKLYSNNGGKFGSSTLDKAFDGNVNTYWETGRKNDENFKNHVIVTFNNIEEINRVVYRARNDSNNKGFASKISIYSSTEETGDRFTLVGTSTATKHNGYTEFKFAPTNFKRLKFVFDEASENWASIGELQFFKQDPILEEADNLFTNGLMNELSKTYKNTESLNKYIEKFNTHPLKEMYAPMISMAKKLASGDMIEEESIITMPQKGHEVEERNRAKISYALYAHEPTGVYLCPGESMDIYVEADPNGRLPEVVIGWADFKPLKVGYNKITLEKGAPEPQRIYLANRALSTQQGFAPKIRVDGGRKYPVYNHKKTKPQDFMKELTAYKETVETDFTKFKNGFTGKNPNFTDLNSENIFIGTSALGAYEGLKNQLDTKQKQVDYTMEVYEDMYREYVKYSGFDYELDASRPWNFRPRGKFMLVGSHAGPFGWAQHGFTGYNGGGGERKKDFWSSLVQASAVEGGGWAVYHEIGHSFDNANIATHESTNNLYSLMMQDKYIGNNRMAQDKRWEKHFTNYHNTKQYPNDQLFLGAITYQLEAVFGKDTYGKAQRIARENKDNWMSGLSNKENHAVAISKALNINVLPHYEYYGITMSTRAKELVKDLPVLDKVVKYVNDKVLSKDAAAFTNKQVKPVVKATSSNGVATLNITIAEPDNALLVYEVFRDDVYLGVTYSNTFVDKAPVGDKKHTYTVKAYDRKLNVSQVSAPVSVTNQ